SEASISTLSVDSNTQSTSNTISSQQAPSEIYEKLDFCRQKAIVTNTEKSTRNWDTSSICLEHITQPTFLNSQWTGKFSPNKLVFPNTQPFRQLKRILFRFEIDGDGTVNGDFPTFTINIFDSGNMTTAEAMYVEAAKDTYFEESSDTSFVTSIFRGNRYFIGKNTYHVRMTRRVTNRIVPAFLDNFGIQPSRDTKSYITTIICVGPIKPWGVVQKWFFGVTTHDELVARLGLNPGSLLSNDEMDTTTANDTLNEMVLVIDDLSTTTANDQDNEIIKKQVNGIIALLKHYIINIPQLKKE
ncbi:7036_t:CDS:2, partial [Entrophospora sp. SA101]